MTENFTETASGLRYLDLQTGSGARSLARLGLIFEVELLAIA
jgi:hypothetical protein